MAGAQQAQELLAGRGLRLRSKARPLEGVFPAQWLAMASTSRFSAARTSRRFVLRPRRRRVDDEGDVAAADDVVGAERPFAGPEAGAVEEGAVGAAQVADAPAVAGDDLGVAAADGRSSSTISSVSRRPIRRATAQRPISSVVPLARSRVDGYGAEPRYSLFWFDHEPRVVLLLGVGANRRAACARFAQAACPQGAEASHMCMGSFVRGSLLFAGPRGKQVWFVENRQFGKGFEH